MVEQSFDELPLKERILKTASSKLVKHFRGLENAGFLPKEDASKLIGCVKKIVAIAEGQEVVEPVHG